MTAIVISEKLKKDLIDFLQNEKNAELLAAYLFFVEKRLQLHPVVFVRDKVIFSNADSAVKKLEQEGKIWREAEIKIGYGPPSVNEETKRIYICPFTGKVFGDNTHPNPQDAIYDWVSKCPENTERVGGVRAKRFFVSEDPEVIKNYIKPPKQTITKIVYASEITGRLFNTKESAIKDFKENHLRPMTLVEVQNQSRFQMDPQMLELVQGQLQEEKIAAFVEAMAEHDELHPYVTKWVETEEE